MIDGFHDIMLVIHSLNEWIKHEPRVFVLAGIKWKSNQFVVWFHLTWMLNGFSVFAHRTFPLFHIRKMSQYKRKSANKRKKCWLLNVSRLGTVAFLLINDSDAMVFSLPRFFSLFLSWFWLKNNDNFAKERWIPKSFVQKLCEICSHVVKDDKCQRL